VRSREQGPVVSPSSPSQALPQKLDAINLQLLEQGNELDLSCSETLQLKNQLINLRLSIYYLVIIFTIYLICSRHLLAIMLVSAPG